MKSKILAAGVIAAAVLAAVAAAFVGPSPGNGTASSHREAPLISEDPVADNTDVYAFVSPDKPNTVTLIASWIPAEEPAGGPNFYAFDDDAWYYIIVDNEGDAKDHIVYEFKFRTRVGNPNTFLYNTGPVTSLDDPDWNVRQFYTVTRYDNGRARVLGTDIPCPPNRIGDTSTPKFSSLMSQAVKTLSDGSKVYAGQSDDPFFVDLGAVFDLLTIRKVPGNQGLGVDGLGGFNVHTIALQVPIDRLVADDKDRKGANPIIGVYSTTSRSRARHFDIDSRGAEFDLEAERSYARGKIQVSRLGAPLVNEVVIPLKDKDRWNASSPRQDIQFLDYVIKPELAGLLNLLYGISVPPTPRNDLVAVFLTGVPGLNQPEGVRAAEFLRLNTAIAPTANPSRLGVLGGDLAGFPNGRRLADDVTDIALRAVAGVLVDGFNISPNNQLGDGVDVNDRNFQKSFPYVAVPHNGLNHGHHRLEAEHPPLALAQAAPVSEGDPEIIDMGSESVSDPEDQPELKVAGPNPSSRPRLEYTLGRAAHATLKVYDLQGREVRSLVDQQAAAGTFSTTWDGRGADGALAGKGVFFARFALDGTVVNIRKLVVR